MALEADVLEGPTKGYIKVVETQKITKTSVDIERTPLPEVTYLVYEVAVYTDSTKTEQLSCPHVDRFKIGGNAEDGDYVGKDPIADAYADLKKRTDRVSNMRDV